MSDQKQFLERMMVSIDRLQATGMLTDREAQRAARRLVKRATETGFVIERTGFRQYRAMPVKGPRP